MNRTTHPTIVLIVAAASLLSAALAGCGADPGQPDRLASVTTDLDADTGPTTTKRPTTTSTTATSTTEPVEEAATESTGGSGLGPVTTTAGGGGGDLAIYTGRLGRLGLDEQLVDAAGPQPSVEAGVLPLTGLAGTVPQHPAAVVKIDNSPRARPQTGLNAADIVVEEEVEGGTTRFAAIFHSRSSIAGPVRSSRTTDIGIVSGLGTPVLMYSGANQVTDDLIRSRPNIINRSAATSSGYWRSRSRSAPHNLYTDTAPHWASASGAPPRPQFHYRQGDQPVAVGDEGRAVTGLRVSYRANPVSWEWAGTHYVRSQGGSPHLTESGEQVSATNVVVIEAERVDTGMVDSSGASVPEFVSVGSGPVTVYTGGRVYFGRWTRPSLASSPVFTTANGELIRLNPGRTWIELVG